MVCPKPETPRASSLRAIASSKSSANPLTSAKDLNYVEISDLVLEHTGEAEQFDDVTLDRGETGSQGCIPKLMTNHGYGSLRIGS
jgi:hypothetical protein